MNFNYNAFIFLVTNQNNKYKLMLVRTTNNKSFGIPGGMSDTDEDPFTTMQREFNEETTNYVTKEELILNNFKIYYYEPTNAYIYYGIIPNKKLRSGSINNYGINMNEIDYIYHLDIHKLFKYTFISLEVDHTYTIKSTSGKSYPLRRAMIDSLKSMIKDKDFKQFIINLII
jgi:8-oxo-dGTP pyrophosphatase MutT (NUDIX family)